jgi:hypothetical protein
MVTNSSQSVNKNSQILQNDCLKSIYTLLIIKIRFKSHTVSLDFPHFSFPDESRRKNKKLRSVLSTLCGIFKMTPTPQQNVVLHANTNKNKLKKEVENFIKNFKIKIKIVLD